MSSLLLLHTPPKQTTDLNNKNKQMNKLNQGVYFDFKEKNL